MGVEGRKPMRPILVRTEHLLGARDKMVLLWAIPNTTGHEKVLELDLVAIDLGSSLGPKLWRERHDETGYY